MEYQAIIKKLKSWANAKNAEGMACLSGRQARFGINSKNTLGVSIPRLRALAKEIGPDHILAGRLWKSGLHEARILAALIDEPKKVVEKQMELWVKDFDSWDVCDQVCGNLFDKTPSAYKKAFKWSKRKEEFVKRAGFVLMATLSVHDKKAPDAKFEQFFSVIKREAKDERNFVKKAVNWALRQIGKRNVTLNKKAIKTAEEILRMDSKSAKWIAKDALKELRNRAIKS